VGGAPGDGAALHRREVLRLVHDDVRMCGGPFDQVGQLVKQDAVGR
jgi:hypothetical protein